jgi:hypothetical protein
MPAARRVLTLPYLNPPYDWESGESNHQRLELVFLEHSYRWRKAGGLLIFVIPQLRLAKCASCLKPDLDPPGTKSISDRLTLIAAAPCSALRLNFRAGNHLPRTPQLRLPTSPFVDRETSRAVANPQSGRLALGPGRPSV